jgi:hypothetical protein
MITIVKSWLINNGLIKREAFVNVDTAFYKEMCVKYSSEKSVNIEYTNALSGNRTDILYLNYYQIKKSTYKSNHHPNVFIFVVQVRLYQLCSLNPLRSDITPTEKKGIGGGCKRTSKKRMYKKNY